ncbi:MAG: hypothetical protein FWF67_06155, partial [Fibromonadales bacterium]|nr:hypothetical protein [Fibromonadales bacterium]
MNLQKNLAKLPAAFILLLVLFHNSFAQCGGKTVYIELPAGWGSTTYILFTGQFKAITGTKENNWTEFTLPNLGAYDEPGGPGLIFSDYSNYVNYDGGINYITKNTIGKAETLNSGSANEFSCSQFGDAGTFIYADPNNPGKTIISLDPPNAKTFYLLPPGTKDYIEGIPYIMNVGSVTKEPMKTDPDGCGWYKRLYFNEPVPDSIVVGLGPSLRSPVTGKKIALASKFRELGSNTIYYQADANRWLTTRAGIPEEYNRCKYTFAAHIYFKGQTGNSFSQYPNGDAEGICRGYVQNTLDTSDPKQ